ncbi:MAG: hypothetical protein ACOCX4_05265, partial [Planctomycetota bacterium]
MGNDELRPSEEASTDNAEVKGAADEEGGQGAAGDRAVDLSETAAADPAAAGGRLGLALVFTAVAAVLGGTLWALIAIHSGYELGFIAWGIGAAAGLGAVLSGAEKGPTLGGMAAAMALVGLLLGKILIVEWGVAPAVAAEIEKNPDLVIGIVVEDMVASGELSAEELATLQSLDEETPVPP